MSTMNCEGAQTGPIKGWFSDPVWSCSHLKPPFHLHVVPSDGNSRIMLSKIAAGCITFKLERLSLSGASNSIRAFESIIWSMMKMSVEPFVPIRV